MVEIDLPLAAELLLVLLFMATMEAPQPPGGSLPPPTRSAAPEAATAVGDAARSEVELQAAAWNEAVETDRNRKEPTWTAEVAGGRTSGTPAPDQAPLSGPASDRLARPEPPLQQRPSGHGATRWTVATDLHAQRVLRLERRRQAGPDPSGAGGEQTKSGPWRD